MQSFNVIGRTIKLSKNPFISTEINTTVFSNHCINNPYIYCVNNAINDQSRT